ncbi:3-oxoacyl-ACP reductase [Ectopseudomonas alcaliphila JAB1]|nr:SDR family oxidoreductase [Pseudomonas alcaliphila]APU30970.1 3-oxoacyl-ACP reductase [Pseudomonas alcaliphila JAB1]
MKTVVVTGATRGLGLAIAKRAALDGYRVVGCGRRLSDELRALQADYPEQVLFESLELNDLGSLHPFAKRIVATHGRPWALVNNAAKGGDGVLATLHERDISELLRINVEAPILLTKYLLRPMLLNRCGRIVNITSIIASTGFSGLSVYAASKAALAGFTRSLAREVGRVGITVNNVAPGYMATEMTSGLQGEKLQSIQRRSPLGRLATPEDVAGAVSYLLGEQAAQVTGTTLTVDAGSTA